MRIITLNANGIRAAARKGFFTWLDQQHADVVCIQETKAQRHQLDDPLYHPKGFHCYYHDAEKKGYSGVAIYSRQQPDRVIEGMGHPDFDREGRYLEVQIGNLSVVSLYMPSGSSRQERQDFKYRCMDFFLPKMEHMITASNGQKRAVVFCGDWNIAHTKDDIKNWRGNQKNSGFLPEERAWLDTVFHEKGFIDAFRELPQAEHQYTWWSNRGKAWENNTGWRIDYHILSPNLKNTVQKTEIYKQTRFSDHAPLIIDYQFDAILHNAD